MGLRGFDRGDIAHCQGGCQVGSVQPGDVVDHASSPRMRGTLKRCCSTSGAPASASSDVRQGLVSSGLKTLLSGTACEVGSISSAAIVLTAATDSKITASW